MGRTPHADCPLAARDVMEAGDDTASTSSLSAAVARASTSNLAGAGGTAPARNGGAAIKSTYTLAGLEMASWQFMVMQAELIHDGLVIDDTTGQLKKWRCSNL